MPGRGTACKGPEVCPVFSEAVGGVVREVREEMDFGFHSCEQRGNRPGWHFILAAT